MSSPRHDQPKGPKVFEIWCSGPKIHMNIYSILQCLRCKLPLKEYSQSLGKMYLVLCYIISYSF